MHSTQKPLTRVRFTITNECPFFAILTMFSGFTKSVFSYAEVIFSILTFTSDLDWLLTFPLTINNDESDLNRNFPIEIIHEKYYS